MPDTGPGTGTEGRTDTGTEGRTDTGAQTTAETQPSFPEARGAAVQGNTVAMLGNQIGTSGFSTALPPTSSTSSSHNFAASVVPAVRGFRISENESPQPIDRVILNFNFFDDVNDSVNRRLGGTLHDLQVYRETLGVEKTCLDGNASIGLRLPLDTLRADSEDPALKGTNTDIGDLTVILKYAFWRNCETGSVLSGGLAATFPTGPRSFADSGLTTFHNTVLQPYVGYLCNRGDFFVHGFIGFDVPTDSNDVTDFFYSVGAGYHLGGNHNGGGFISDIIPTLEAHLNDPLNHRGAFRLDDPAASTDSLSLTGGVTLIFGRGCTLALGMNTPVTGPKPYNWEFLCQLNLRFGRWAGVPGGPTSILGF
jgi:hypothetical protein